MSSDDDMPPPLEDMSEQIKMIKANKEKAQGNMGFGGNKKTEDHVEEVRLAPKKQAEGQKALETIMVDEGNITYNSTALSSLQEGLSVQAARSAFEQRERDKRGQWLYQPAPESEIGRRQRDNNRSDLWVPCL